MTVRVIDIKEREELQKILEEKRIYASLDACDIYLRKHTMVELLKLFNILK